MLDHGVTRWKVRVARERAGAPKLPRGRKRGVVVRVAEGERVPAAVRIAARIKREQRPGGAPATLGHIATCVSALHAASINGDRLALLDALEAVGAAAGLVLDHLDAGGDISHRRRANFGAITSQGKVAEC